MLLSNRYKKCPILRAGDYDRSPHKMIATLFLKIAIMIAVLIKCTIYEGCDHGRSPHRNIMFLNLYKIATMIAILFIKTTTMVAVFIEMSYI